MPIYYPDILKEGTLPLRFSYTDKDLMLYALGIGMGQDPMNSDELQFVYEKELKVVPTVATVLAQAAVRRSKRLPQTDGHRESAPNRLMAVHGDQKVELYKPWPSVATFTAESRTIGAFDKGKDKGAVLVVETICKDKSGDVVARLTASSFYRADGGFGGPSERQAGAHITPSRKPDLSVRLSTRPDQALLYRLNGDRNPLHADPGSARRSGFPGPILHGLCTYGLTCRAVLQAFTNYDPDKIASHEARFSAPVFPGETVTVDLWQDGAVISFEARVTNRGATVIKNGKTVLR